MRIIVAGGGAAGFFAAIAAAEAAANAGRPAAVTVLEKGTECLTKVRISGGGRCNVTHACFDPRTLAACYPRGERALIGPFTRFQPADTVAWFEKRGVRLKTEPDGRMFPVTDSSQTIIDCLVRCARQAGVVLRNRCGIQRAARSTDGGFDLQLADGSVLACDRLLLATGGCRTPAGGELAVTLGHSLEPPVPSLFTFHIETPWLRELAGLSVATVEASVPGTNLRERGPLLATHWGVSGPVILPLSAWGARIAGPPCHPTGGARCTDARTPGWGRGPPCAAVGATRVGIRSSSRRTLGHFAESGPQAAGGEPVADGIPSHRQELEQVGVCHVRWGATARG